MRSNLFSFSLDTVVYVLPFWALGFGGRVAAGIRTQCSWAGRGEIPGYLALRLHAEYRIDQVEMHMNAC